MDDTKSGPCFQYYIIGLVALEENQIEYALNFLQKI